MGIITCKVIFMFWVPSSSHINNNNNNNNRWILLSGKQDYKISTRQKRKEEVEKERI